MSQKATVYYKSQLDRACYCMKVLMDKFGVSDYQAAGLAGCFLAESGCDPTSYNKLEKQGRFPGSSANGPGYGAGIAQFSKSLKRDLQSLCGRYTPIESWSLEQQMQGVCLLIKPAYVTKLKNCKTVTEATHIALAGFENGGAGNGALASVSQLNKYTWAGGYSGLMNSRGSAAIQALTAFRGGNSGQGIDPSEIGTISYAEIGMGSGTFSIGSSSSISGSIVLQTASANIYSNIDVQAVDNSSLGHHTRIYKYSDPSKEIVKELNLPVDGSDSTYDSSTGLHEDEKDNLGEQNDLPDRTSGNQSNIQKKFGVIYPIIKIRDHIVAENEIAYFEIATVNFLPTMRLILQTHNNDIIKWNAVTHGDVISIFMASGNDMIKSLRCDFLITYVDVLQQSQMKMNNQQTYEFYGELYIPDLYNMNMTYAFPGTSMQAMIDIASKLKIGFFFNDPEDTADSQIWYSMSEKEESFAPAEPNEPLAVSYIKNVTAHAWKNPISFFDSWIDPRYGLTFLNMNKQLGEDGPDENIDVTVFINSIINSRSIDKHGTKHSKDAKKTAQPQVKILSNITSDIDSATAYYITSFSEINQASQITKELGTIQKESVTFDNMGLGAEENLFELQSYVTQNEWKLKNGFYVLMGPGYDLTTAPAKAQHYVDQNEHISGGKILNVQSDTDGEEIVATGSNETASGNVNKFYDAAIMHNRFNNMQLKKKLVKFTLQGMNLSIMRGEKIPAIVVDNNAFNMAIQYKGQRNNLANLIIETYSGWFVIASIKWIYKPNNGSPTSPYTSWTTEVTLTRREWPIPGYFSAQLDTSTGADSSQGNFTTNPSQGTTAQGVNVNGGTSNSSTNQTASTGSKTSASEVASALNQGQEQSTSSADDIYTEGSPVAGLQDFMADIYDTIRDDVKLLSGRRYAVDEEGNRIEDMCNAYVTNGGNYKCMDSQGHIVYYATNNSRHLYGEAIDVIPNSGDIQEFMSNNLAFNASFLYLCYQYGVSPYIETSRDDTGAESQHIHIGTETKYQSRWWSLISTMHYGYTITSSGSSFNFANYASNNRYISAEITHANVKEVVA